MFNLFYADYERILHNLSILNYSHGQASSGEGLFMEMILFGAIEKDWGLDTQQRVLVWLLHIAQTVIMGHLPGIAARARIQFCFGH